MSENKVVKLDDKKEQEEKISLNIGKKDFEVKPNFRKDYKLTKYRNRLTYGFDFSKADRDVIEELTELRNVKEKELDLSSLSEKTLEFLSKVENQQQINLTDDELIDIGMILTDITTIDEIESLYNIEVEENGYDVLISKLVVAVKQVFMNAKSGS